MTVSQSGSGGHSIASGSNSASPLWAYALIEQPGNLIARQRTIAHKCGSDSHNPMAR